MGAIDKSTGSLLLGSWVNGMFFVFNMAQVLRYFQEYNSRDPPAIRWAVAVCFATNIAATVGLWAGVYLEAITHWGDESYLERQDFVTPLYCITTGIIGLIVQTFLTSRASKLIKSLYLRAPVVLFLMAFTLTGFAGSIWTAISVIRHPAYADRGQEKLPATVWIVAAAGGDVAIALTLLWQLALVKRSYTGGVESRLSGVLSRLSLIAIQTGSTTAALAALALILFLTDDTSNATVGTGFSLGNLYTISMLVCLNSRNDLSGAPNTSRSTDKFRFGFSPNAARPAPGILTVDGVTVHHEQTVHIEEPFRLHDLARRIEHQPQPDFSGEKDLYGGSKAYV